MRVRTGQVAKGALKKALDLGAFHVPPPNPHHAVRLHLVRAQTGQKSRSPRLESLDLLLKDPLAADERAGSLVGEPDKLEDVETPCASLDLHDESDGLPNQLRKLFPTNIGG